MWQNESLRLTGTGPCKFFQVKSIYLHFICSTFNPEAVEAGPVIEQVPLELKLERLPLLLPLARGRKGKGPGPFTHDDRTNVGLAQNAEWDIRNFDRPSLFRQMSVFKRRFHTDVSFQRRLVIL